jgi:hypothetical protein
MGAEYYSPWRKPWVRVATSEFRREAINETGGGQGEGHGFSRAVKRPEKRASACEGQSLRRDRTSE